MKRIGLLIPLLCLTLHARAADERRDLWLYYPTNLQVDANVDTLEKIWTRAAKAGYGKVLLADSKLARLGELGDNTKRYFNNVDRTRKIAAGLKIEIVPALFDIGYSNNLLYHNPNLAEGLPARDTPFIVKSGEARIAAAPIPLDKPGFNDPAVVINGALATLEGGYQGNARFTYKLSLTPFRCYHVSVRIKMDAFTARPEIKALADDKSGVVLTHAQLSTQPTQDWKEAHIVFNTLEHPNINLYFGVWGTAKGKLQWKDWRIEEIGLVNVLRREGAPLVVKTEDSRTLVEGKDYEKIVDPHLGNTPWPGEYEAYHEPPTIHTKLADGTKLKVSWFHPVLINDGQVMCCLSEPELKEILSDQARRMKAAWSARGYMMSHDEIRTMNWDAACQAQHETPGKLLAENVRLCTRLLEGSTVYVWSDMFDPFHNAVKGPYYLVNGDLSGSWDGLDRNVVIINWNSQKMAESLKFFADRGNHQVIAGYYDGKVDAIKGWLSEADKVKGVSGVMYTTWRNNYDDLEAFAAQCR